MPLATVAQEDPNERFSDYEIRVVRPKFFQKRERFELGGQLNLVMNDTFVYTLLASGILSYHFTESWAGEVQGAYGYSFDRAEKTILNDDFDIKTTVFRTSYFLEGSILYTPIYGKWQLSEGRFMYFDTFLALGGGMTGLEWRYSDFCFSKDPAIAASATELPADKTTAYPSGILGLGQRIFQTTKFVWRWDLRTRIVMYDKADESCNPEAASSGGSTYQSILLQVGASRFF